MRQAACRTPSRIGRQTDDLDQTLYPVGNHEAKTCETELHPLFPWQKVALAVQKKKKVPSSKTNIQWLESQSYPHREAKL